MSQPKFVDKLCFPVGKDNQDPMKDYKIDTYFLDPDYKRETGAWHTGLDFNGQSGGNTDMGDSVWAIGNGVIVENSDFPVWGRVILIKHVTRFGQVFFSQYAHLIKPIQGVDIAVNMGQKIGEIGRGENDRFVAHLHFEVRRRFIPANAWPKEDLDFIKSNYYDPAEFLFAMRGKLGQDNMTDLNG